MKKIVFLFVGFMLFTLSCYGQSKNTKPTFTTFLFPADVRAKEAKDTILYACLIKDKFVHWKYIYNASESKPYSIGFENEIDKDIVSPNMTPGQFVKGVFACSEKSEDKVKACLSKLIENVMLDCINQGGVHCWYKL